MGLYESTTMDSPWTRSLFFSRLHLSTSKPKRRSPSTKWRILRLRASHGEYRRITKWMSWDSMVRAGPPVLDEGK
eukprot:scaffold6500_cov109-Isochrysis_galbana.AAC.6